MATLLVLYNMPSDPKVFDDYYFSTHLPLAKKIPGLRSYQVNASPIGTPSGPSPYHLIATLSFDSMEAIVAAFASDEGKAAAADLANFAQAGASLQMFETRLL